MSSVGRYDPQITEGLIEIVEPIKLHKRSVLCAIVAELKQSSREHRAVGEMLERACIFLGALEMGGIEI